MNGTSMTSDAIGGFTTFSAAWNYLMPVDFYEVGLFSVFIIALYLIFVLFFYDSVMNTVTQTSRCYRANQSANSNGVFTANASNQKGDSLYTVAYDMGAKTYNVECACPTGNVLNTYPKIDVYNLNTQQAQRIDKKMCSCDKQYYSPVMDSIYYSGYPGITRFMNSASILTTPEQVQSQADTSFFEDSLYGVAYNKVNTY